MGENSKIEWTDHTFNPWIGCAKVHEGCQNCYAEREFDLRLHRAKWGPRGTRTLTVDANWRKPVNWDAAARNGGVRKRVFCASLADVFEEVDHNLVNMVDHKGMPIHECCNCGAYTYRYDATDTFANQGLDSCCQTMDLLPLSLPSVRRRLFNLIDATPNLDWLLLTKRPENIRKMWIGEQGDGIVDVWSMPPGDYPRRMQKYRANVWLGTSISTQAHADKQISELLKCRDLCAGLFVSIEPMLGPIDLLADPSWFWSSNIKWVIVGGESGPQARPMHHDWVRSIRDQCVAAGVPFFFKQWGEWVSPEQSPEDTFREWDAANNAGGHPDSYKPLRFGLKKAGAVLDGREWRETPFQESTHGNV